MSLNRKSNVFTRRRRRWVPKFLGGNSNDKTKLLNRSTFSPGMDIHTSDRTVSRMRSKRRRDEFESGTSRSWIPMITTITITSVTTRNKLEFVDTLFFQGAQTIPNLTISRNAKRLILHAAAQRGSDGARLTVTTSNGDTSTEVMPTAMVMFDVDCQTFPPTLSEPTTETTDELLEKKTKTFEGFSPHLSATVSLNRERRQIQSRSTPTGFYSRNR